MNVQEVVNEWPIGRKIQLSQRVREIIAYLYGVVDAIPYMQNRVTELLNQRGIDPEAELDEEDDLKRRQAAKQCSEVASNEDPFKAAVSNTLSSGFGPLTPMAQSISARVLHSIVWAEIYAEIRTGYKMSHDTWAALNIALEKSKTPTYIIVTGHNFSPEQLGEEVMDPIPDFPPLDWINGDDN